ncbi:MAG TPA: mandelate racemase/muconate lactonizing enzyme family protein [Rhodopila sp.]
MSIRLARIETFLYRAEVSEPVKTSFGSIPRRSALLLRVEDADGAHGWGEIWCNFPPYSADNKVRLMETVVAPAALGQSFHDPADAWQTLTARTRRWAIQGAEQGPIGACIAGLDLALWDMTARRAGVSLSRLLGASPDKVSVPVYASGLNPDTAVEAVERARAAGFTAFKVKVAFGLEQDLAVLERLKRALRPQERVMVDANQGWDMVDARRAVPAIAAYDVGWIEEPIPADSAPEEWAELAMLSAVPIAGGENVAGFRDFAALIGAGSHRVVQPDMLKWGGVTGCFAVARRAVAKGLTYCPHWLGSGVGLMAAAHVLAAVGGPGLLEHDAMENPLREVLAKPFPRVHDGVFPLPAGSGLGVEPSGNEAAAWLLNHQELLPKG